MSYLRLIGLFFRLGALNEMAYRVNFGVQLIQTSIRLAVAVTGLSVVYNYTDNLAGWTQPELLALVGVYFLIDGCINLVVRPSMNKLMEAIRLGTLDFTLTKPVDSQLLVSAQQVEIWRLVDIGLGLTVISIGLVRLEASVGLVEAAAFALALLCGASIVYSVLLVLSTLCFWFVKLDNILVIFQTLYEAGRWPVRIYPQWLQVTLTFMVPVAFAITVPTEALVGRLTWSAMLVTVGLAAGTLLISRLFWRYGVRHYSGASA